jgi:2,3-bisphosphoglycerate-dependent phosphoglycerate mutase
MLVLLRHGQSTANAEGRFTGWADIPLTARGEKQAAAVAQLLARDGLVLDVVPTSVLRRSIRTAEILLEELDRSWIPVHRTWRLNERRYGALTGRLKREVRREVGPRGTRRGAARSPPLPVRCPATNSPVCARIPATPPCAAAGCRTWRAWPT